MGLHNHLLLTLLKRAHELNSSEKESLHKLKKRKLTASKNAAAAASASAAAAAAALEEQEEVETGKNKARIRRRMLKRYILSLPKSDRDRIKINLKQVIPPLPSFLSLSGLTSPSLSRREFLLVLEVFLKVLEEEA